jgi:hypothetical protein
MTFRSDGKMATSTANVRRLLKPVDSAAENLGSPCGVVTMLANTPAVSTGSPAIASISFAPVKVLRRTGAPMPLLSSVAVHNLFMFT